MSSPTLSYVTSHHWTPMGDFRLLCLAAPSKTIIKHQSRKSLLEKWCSYSSQIQRLVESMPKLIEAAISACPYWNTWSWFSHFCPHLSSSVYTLILGYFGGWFWSDTWFLLADLSRLSNCDWKELKTKYEQGLIQIIIISVMFCKTWQQTLSIGHQLIQIALILVFDQEWGKMGLRHH